MTETIESIEVVEEHKLGEDRWHSTYEGYEVKTNKRNILVLVSDVGDCCEVWGHISSDDDLPSYIGAELLDINWVDTDRKKHFNDDLAFDEGGDMMFVDFVTSRGLLQLAVYNDHNGYYGHPAKLIVGDSVEIDTVL